MFRTIPLLLLLLLNAVAVIAAPHLEFTVTVKDGTNGLSTAVAEVFIGGQKVDVKGADSKGAIKLDLEYGKEYRIVVNEIHHEPLAIEINTTIPKDKSKFIYIYGTTIEMVRRKDGFKPSYKGESVMKVEYVPKKDSFGTREAFELSYEYVPAKEQPKGNPDGSVRQNPQNTDQGKDPVQSNNTPAVKDTPAVAIAPADTAQTTAPADTVARIPVAAETEKEVKLPPPTAPKPVDVAKKADGIVDQEARNNKAKALLEELEREKDRDSDIEMNNAIIKSSSRRTFLEEIADSKREIKKASRTAR